MEAYMEAQTPKTNTLSPRSAKLLAMLKKFRWVIVIAIIIAGLFLFGRGVKHYNTTQKEYVTFTAVDGSFSLEHPRNWTVQLPGKGAIVATLVTDAVPTSSTMKPYINIAKGAVQGSLEDEYKKTIEKYKKLFRNLRVVSEEPTTFGGEPARMIVMEGSVGGRQMHYAVAFTEYK